MKSSCEVCGQPVSKTGNCTVCDSAPTVLQVGDPSSAHGTAFAGNGNSPQTSAGVSVSSAASNPYYIVPGTVLAGRYRIVSPVGKGGMGQVYRADDLKLRETVALKFLPESLANDPAWLGRFFLEVRTAREVTHPNVCRVHDIVESADEHRRPLTFLSMEFVDGENLEDIFRRFGRLPTDKGLDIGGEIASALAAAHARGVLHRDLKPANILIDGRGNAKLADFGLALGRRSETGSELAGTPGYIAPELLKGAPATGRSDLYALGLVLYELLTGRKASKDGKPLTASIRQLAPEVPAEVEQMVLACSDPDPANRPVSAAEVAAVFPQRQNALEEALARGETPSPEMVADAADDAPLSLRTGWLMMAALVVILLVRWVATGYGDFVGVMPPRISPEEAAVHARDLLEKFGYPVTGVPHVMQTGGNFAMLDWIAVAMRPEQKRQFPGSPQGSLLYQYVQSYSGSVLPEFDNSTGNFLPSGEGELRQSIVLDSDGNLVGLTADNRGLPAAAPHPTDWASFLSATGIDTSTLKAEDAKFDGPFSFDERRAWTGSYIGHPQWLFHIHAASWQGRPAYLDIQPDAKSPPPGGLVSIRVLLNAASSVVFLFLGAGLVFVNLKNKRGDVVSATRLALLFFACQALGYLTLIGWQSRSAVAFTSNLNFVLAFALLGSLFVWVAYVAVEPLARRRLPGLLQGSTLLLRGQWNKPRIGTEMFIGALAGAAMATFYVLIHAVEWRYAPGGTLDIGTYDALTSAWRQVGQYSYTASSGIWNATASSVALTVCWLMVRRRWLAVLLTFVIASANADTRGGLLLALSISLFFAGVLLFLLIRFGVLANATAFLIGGIIDIGPWTHSPGSWMMPQMLFCLATVAGACCVCFWLAIGRRNPFGAFKLET